MFKSENLSTISVVKEIISKQATKKNIAVKMVDSEYCSMCSKFGSACIRLDTYTGHMIGTNRISKPIT